MGHSPVKLVTIGSRLGSLHLRDFEGHLHSGILEGVS